MNPDAYYEPAYPIREREETRDCATCDAETLHAERVFRFVVERECLTCGDITEVDDEQGDY